MADAEIIRRRELRKRKILECSEARFKRITSTKKYQVANENSDDCSVSSQNIEKDLIESRESGSINFGIKTNEFLGGVFPARSYNANINESQCNKNNNSAQPRRRLVEGGDAHHTIATNGSSHRPYSPDYYEFPKKVSDAETRSFARTRCDARRNSTCTQMMMETLQLSSFSLAVLRPWITVFLAFIVKAYFLITETFPVFGTIFFPYLVLEIAFCSWTKFESQVCARPTASSLIPGVLLLCGLPASFVSGFSVILNIFQCAVQDFAVYVFTFIFLHFICETWM